MVKQSSFYVDAEVKEAIGIVTKHIKRLGFNPTINGAVRFSLLKMARELSTEAESP